LLGKVHAHVADVRKSDSNYVAGRRFNFDDLGAQIPKGFGAMGPGKHPGKIDYAQSVQRSRHC